MSAEGAKRPDRNVIEQAESYIGKSVIRPQAARLLAGRGVFTDDVRLPRMLHVAFLRSPHAHARIVSLDARAALALPGVARVVTGDELAGICAGWVGTLAHFQGMKSAMQYPLARGRAKCSLKARALSGIMPSSASKLPRAKPIGYSVS